VREESRSDERANMKGKRERKRRERVFMGYEWGRDDMRGAWDELRGDYVPGRYITILYYCLYESGRLIAYQAHAHREEGDMEHKEK
jgi:hypothetical protein